MKTIIREMEISDIDTIYNEIHLKYINKYCKDNEEEYQKHRKWYEFIINSDSFVFFIFEDENKNFIGTARYALDEEQAVLSVYIKENFRGQNLSKKLILNTIDILKNKNIKYVLAYILPENTISINLFKKLEFNNYGFENYDGVKHLLFEKNIDKEMI